MKNAQNFKEKSLGERTKTMLKVDFRRMLKSKTFYIIIAAALVLPIIMTVMMSIMDGSVSVNPQTGEETVIRGPENAWQNIGTLPGGENMGGTEIFAMCNVNMAFMGVAVFVCHLFQTISEADTLKIYSVFARKEASTLFQKPWQASFAELLCSQHTS